MTAYKAVTKNDNLHITMIINRTRYCLIPILLHITIVISRVIEYELDPMKCFLCKDLLKLHCVTAVYILFSICMVYFVCTFPQL